jgi:branched-chain amino acid transport system permease protein
MRDAAAPAIDRTRRLPDEILAIAALAALLVAAPLAIYPFLLAQALCMALFACAFNLLVGYGGLLSFGHALFFGWASYFAAHMAKGFGWPPELAIAAATICAGALGLVAGALSIRRQGIYFSMITLALAQLGYFVALQVPFTHGEDGIQGVPRGKLFGLVDLGNDLALYYTVLAIFLFGLFGVYRVVHSPFGAVLKAIRENEPRAISLGYRAERYKLAAFVLSATLAGLAGATKAIVAQSATLTDAHWTMSGEVILMTLVGGMGTIVGPVLGAFVIVAMKTYFSAMGQWVTVIQGVIFVLCVLAFRRGVVGEIAARFKLSL